MPHRLLLLAAPESRARALVEAGAAGEHEVALEAAGAEAGLAAAAEAPDSVWIDARSRDALSAAQEIRQLHPAVPFVFVVPGGRREVLQQMLLLTPLLGDAALISEEELPQRFGETFERVRSGTALRGTLDELNRRIAEGAGDRRRRMPGSDRYLASLLAHAPDAIFSTDLEGRIQSWNQAAVATFAHAPADIAGEDVSLLAAEDARASATELVRRAAAGEVARRRDLRCRRRDGSIFEAEWTLTLVRDELGDPRAVAIIARDVSEQRRLEEGQEFLIRVSRTLAESLDYQTTLRTVARLSVPFLADWCVIDVQQEGGEIERVASAHAEPELEPVVEELLRGFPPRRDSRQPGIMAIRDADAVFLPEIEGALEEHTESPAHRDILHRLGTCSVLAVPLAARERVLGAVTFVYGHSGRRHRTAHLALADEVGRRAAMAVDNARLYTKAQEALRAREELIAIVSHDLRNPLAAATLAAALMATDVPEEARAKQVRVLDRSLSRMSRLVDDLLDLSRLESGRLSISPEPVAVAPLLDDVCEEHKAVAEQKGNAIRCRPEPDLPPVHADRGRLVQVLGNLVGNALKFSPPGAAVEIVARQADGAVELSVRDRGPGLAPEQKERVFDRFWQGRANDERGVGLGLAIARGLVEAHGGRIWVESEAGEGADFRFTIPLAPG